MLILFETAAGFALFRTDKPKKLEKVENLQKYIEDVDGLRKLYSSFYLALPWKIFTNSNLPPMPLNASLNS